MRGRKPKPTTQRIREGNPGKRPLNLDEPQPAAFDAREESPPELAGHALALAEWRRLLPELEHSRQITKVDRGALLAVCLEWERYLVATAEVQRIGMVVKTPSGYPMVNPFLSVASKALAATTKLWVELGCTPSSRSRVVTQAPAPGDDWLDEFDTPPPRGPMAEPPTEH